MFLNFKWIGWKTTAATLWYILHIIGAKLSSVILFSSKCVWVFVFSEFFPFELYFQMRNELMWKIHSINWSNFGERLWIMACLHQFLNVLSLWRTHYIRKIYNNQIIPRQTAQYLSFQHYFISSEYVATIAISTTENCRKLCFADGIL